MGGRPGPRFAEVGFVAGFAVACFAAGALRVVFAAVFFAASAAFSFSSFSLSRASYSSFDGILSVMRFSPDASASKSSFSLLLALFVLLAWLDGTRGTDGRWGARAGAVVVLRAFFTATLPVRATAGTALRRLAVTIGA